MGQCMQKSCEAASATDEKDEVSLERSGDQSPRCRAGDSPIVLDEDSPEGSLNGGEDSPEMAQRRILYLQRKQAKQEKRKKMLHDQFAKNYLSDLPETEDDVQYRFNFVVVGREQTATRTITSVCGSEEAAALGKAISAPLKGEPAECTRCLCHIDEQQRKRAKLIFVPRSFGQDIPPCLTRNEALSTVLAFLIYLDNSSPHAEEKLRKQLTAYERTVSSMRKQIDSKLRPVRAVLLCEISNGEKPHARSWWTSQLSDFEQKHGDLWKFGPIDDRNANALHGAFAEMATVRIANYQKMSDNPADREVEVLATCEEDIVKTFNRPSAGSIEDQIRLNTMAMTKTMSSGTLSVGFSPPTWDTERSGSGCEEELVQEHIKAFEEG